MIKLPDILLTNLNENTVEVTLLTDKARDLAEQEFKDEIKKDALLVSKETANKIVEFSVIHGLKIDSELNIIM